MTLAKISGTKMMGSFIQECLIKFRKDSMLSYSAAPVTLPEFISEFIEVS